MEHQQPLSPDTELSAATTGDRRRWPRRIGVIAGIAALAAGAIGFSTAGAQTGDTDDANDAETDVVHGGVITRPIDMGEPSAFDECLGDALPIEEVVFQDVALEDDAFETPPDGAELDGMVEISPEEIKSFDADFDAAIEDCEDLLTDEERADMEAWEPFEACLDEQAGEWGPFVAVEAEDGQTFGSFDDGTGTITVTAAEDGAITVEADGSGTVTDSGDLEADGEWFAAGEAECEHLIPEELGA